MFDSVLVLEPVPSSRLARAELAAAVVGAHVAVVAALIVAQSWRVEPVSAPDLLPQPYEPVVEVAFDQSPPPAKAPPPPKLEPRAAAAPAAPDPNQMVESEVPQAPPVEAPPVEFGVAPGTAATDGTANLGDGSGEAVPVDPSGAGRATPWDGRMFTRPVAIFRIEPVYPRLGQVQRRNGVVQLRAEISIDGTVRGLEVVEAAPKGFGFEESALQAVRQWRFEPARSRDGKPVAVLYLLQVTFTVR